MNFAIRRFAEYPFQTVTVFTDGLERLCLEFPGGTPHAEFFKPLFTGLEQLPDSETEGALTQLLTSTPFAARSDDDKTLVVAQLT